MIIQNRTIKPLKTIRYKPNKDKNQYDRYNFLLEKHKAIVTYNKDAKNFRPFYEH
jgi:hypothetical protein